MSFQLCETLMLQKGAKKGVKGWSEGGAKVKLRHIVPAHELSGFWVLGSLTRDNGCDVAGAESSSAW